MALNGCTFGECVRQNVIDGGGGNTAAPTTSASKSLPAGVIAGLAVVGGLIVLALFLLALGLLARRRARKNATEIERNRASVVWSELSYMIPSKKNKLFGSRKGDPSEVNSDKVILDNVSGAVRPGQMMAILGPSGASFHPIVK